MRDRRATTLHADAAARLYGSKEWRAARLAFLSSRPLCVVCEAQGRSVIATDVDHVVAHRGDRARFFDRANWQPLCHAHHSAKTAREDSGFVRAQAKALR